MSVYRSGLMLRPPIAVGGHSWTIAVPAVDALGDLFPAVPALWTCSRCHVHSYRTALEAPCTGLMRALSAPGGAQ